jgi:MFS family permease
MSLKNISEFLALRRNTSLLLVALLLAGTGEKLWLGFAPKYIEVLAHGVLSAAQIILIIGLFDALQTFLGAIYAYPGGWLTDHWGQRKSLLLFSAISISGYVLVLVWQSWLALLLGSFLFLAWSALSLPATLSVIATSLQSNRHTMGVGVQSMIRRVPMMIGPLIGGWLLTRFGWTDGVRYALALCIVMSLLTAAFQWFMFEPDGNAAAAQNKNSTAATISFLGVVKTFTPALKELLVSDILIRFCERIPYAFIILWAMDSGGVTAQQFGYLVTFEMVTAMLCYIPVAHLADKYGRRPFVLITFVFFTLFPGDAALRAQLRVAGAGVRRARAERIRRAGTQGAHHRGGYAGTARPDLRRVLSHPRLHRDERLFSRRVALVYQPACQLHWRGRLRGDGNALVLVVYLPEERQLGSFVED